MTIRYQLTNSMTSNVVDDYTYYEDIFNEDDEKISKLKYIITNHLTDTERMIWIRYCELDSNTNELAREMNVNSPALRYYLKKIKQKILYYYDNRPISNGICNGDDN